MDPRRNEPTVRIRALAEFASSIKLENRIPIKRYPLPLHCYFKTLPDKLYFYRYIRSGTEMLRMADVYYKEGSLESAYTLYLKFLTCVLLCPYQNLWLPQFF